VELGDWNFGVLLVEDDFDQTRIFGSILQHCKHTESSGYVIFAAL
jgi:hypothetical protein